MCHIFSSHSSVEIPETGCFREAFLMLFPLFHKSPCPIIRTLQNWRGACFPWQSSHSSLLPFPPGENTAASVDPNCFLAQCFLLCILSEALYHTRSKTTWEMPSLIVTRTGLARNEPAGRTHTLSSCDSAFFITKMKAALVVCDAGVGHWPKVAITIGGNILNADDCFQRSMRLRG